MCCANFWHSEHIVLWWYTVHWPVADWTCTVGLCSAVCFRNNSCHGQCITASTLICCYLQDYRGFTRLCWEVQIMVCRYGWTQLAVLARYKPSLYINKMFICLEQLCNYSFTNSYISHVMGWLGLRALQAGLHTCVSILTVISPNWMMSPLAPCSLINMKVSTPLSQL